MQATCARCAKTLDYSGERPRFCAFCGNPLATPTPAAAEPVVRGEKTDPPAADAETIAVAPGSADRSAEAAPELVGGYRLLRKLGGGGMGAVYEAEHTASGRRVALKLVLPEFAGAGEALARFRQEGRLASSLAHPRCVFVLAADEEAGRPYIVMELMPGDNLDDLVRRRGPLPPEEALAKILDVVDGLAEAHRLGLVHRDVKPSNCFLEAGGRVKVGDFGLARSLVSDLKLTRTGSFVGTPLFAAPEQLKREEVDPQSDVYSVAATLYFLLTGKAPFQSEGGDAMATLARIVSDDPPPLRSLRPDLPKALDKVVMRGLARDRRRRWKDLGEFRRALIPLLPARPSAVSLGMRVGAYLIDSVLLMILGVIAGATVVRGAVAGAWLPGLSPWVAGMIYGHLSGLFNHLTYFGLQEGLWGWSLGKGLLRLRVGVAGGVRPPGVGRAVLRAAILFVLLNLGTAASQALMFAADMPNGVVVRNQPMTGEQALLMSLAGMASIAGFILAAVAILIPMRAANGYRGLHEILSGTRTFQLRWPQAPERRAVRAREFHLEVTQPEGMPARFGPFLVKGALRWTDRERTLLAEDPQLGRSVWLWVRPASEPPLDAARRDVSRATRIRWVACGTEGPWQWDAFLAPAGMPLPVLAAGQPRLGWAEARTILHDLAEELAASCADGTLPESLALHQVWVQPDGRVRLLGTPLTGTADAVAGNPADGDPVPATDDQERALQFLRAAAVTALEGAPRPVAPAGDSIRAPLPPYAADVLNRLLDPTRAPYRSVEEIRQDLEATQERPAEVTRLRRAGHLALTILFLHLPLLGPVILVAAPFAALMVHWESPQDTVRMQRSSALAVAFVVGNCGFWILWALVFRGGYAYWRGGITLRRADGRKASRWQCGLRALLVWAPVAGLILLAVGVAELEPSLGWLYFSLFAAGVLLMPLYVVRALLKPDRLPHDRLTGTYPVPE
jgi:hypothetical protein